MFILSSQNTIRVFYIKVDLGRLMRAIVWVMANQLLVGIPVAYVVYKLMAWQDCCIGRELPTFHWVLLELVIFSLIEEVLFYYSHR